MAQSWSKDFTLGGQHCFSSVGQEEGCEPYGSVRGHSQAPEDHWDLCNPLPGILFESVEDARLESLEDYAIDPFDLTVSTWVFDRGPIDLMSYPLLKSRNFFLVKFIPWSMMIQLGTPNQ